MRTTITPALAEEALDAISKIEVKALNNPAGYALTKNALSLTRVVKNYHTMRKETRAALAAPGVEIKPESEEAAKLAQAWSLAAHTDVEVNLHKMKLTELLRHCTVKDATAFAPLDFLIEDDLPLDGEATPQ